MNVKHFAKIGCNTAERAFLSGQWRRKSTYGYETQLPVISALPRFILRYEMELYILYKVCKRQTRCTASNEKIC
jgi:hypothetical protein